MECTVAELRCGTVITVGCLCIGEATRLVTGPVPISPNRNTAFNDDAVVTCAIRLSFLSALPRPGVSNARQREGRSDHSVCFRFAARVDDCAVRRSRNVRRRLALRIASNFDITDGYRELAVVLTGWVMCVWLPRPISTNL